MFEWSKNGDKIAYIKFDESQVPEYSMDVYGTDLYPSQDKFKYPKAGEKNAEVSLYIYDIQNNSSLQVDLSEFNDFYIPRIKWTNDNQYLSAQVINRHQNDIKLYFIDGNTQAKTLILNETDQAYVDIHDVNFFDDNQFIWTSERDGYNHLYHYDKNGKLINQVTNGSWEVTNYYGIDSKTKTLFYQSVERGSIYRDIYAINLNGKNKKTVKLGIGN
jgi:dipeptidyl-peptidase-4